MAKNLVIIESKGKIEKVQDFLGADFEVMCSLGHVRDLPQKGDGEDVIVAGIAKNYRPIYEETERGASIIARLKRAASKAESVWLATDPDREGESIAWHLQQALGLTNPIRVSFNEVTLTAIQKAFSAPGKIDMKKVGAQECRRLLDRLVGYLVSPELSRQLDIKASAGRVQSPAVYLIVIREREIRCFKATSHFEVELFFADAKNPEAWKAKWQLRPDFTTEDRPYFQDEAAGRQVAAIRDVVVEQFTQKPTRRAPPAPFTTSTFQQAASNSLKLGPKIAMDLAQALYDAGHISYHRTDNPNISEDSMPALRAAATAMGLEVVEERREFSAKEGAQIGHPGITPTYWDVECAGDTPEQQAVYRLIRIRAIASQLLDAEYLQRSVVLLSQQTLNGKPLRFAAVGSTMTAPGWTQLMEGDSTKDNEEEEEAFSLPELQVGMSLTASKGELVAKKTRAPKRYKEASLVKALEDLGIGRPATYASIIEGIKSRGYIKMGTGQFLSPTELGEQVVDGLVGKFQFMDLGFTRELEEDLDRIAAGQANAVEVLKRLHLQLESEIGVQRSTVSAVVRNPCPECGMSMRRIKGGEKGFFWGCTGYPKCSATLPDDNGKPGQRKNQELSNFECKLCSSRLVNLKKKGQYNFWRCSDEKKGGCNQRYQDVKGKPDYAGSK